MLTTMCVLVAVFGVVAFAVAVFDGQRWCERHDYEKHRED